MRTASARSLTEISEAVRESPRLVVCEHPESRVGGYGLDWQDTATWLHDERPHEMELVAADFYVEVSANFPLDLLQAELLRKGVWLPLDSISSRLGESPSVRDGLSWNYPNLAEGSQGNWKDWVLGMEAVGSDGAVVRFGSKVTKNAAGFDAHKFLVGSRNAFMIPTRLTLRVYPAPLDRPPTQKFTPLPGTWAAQRCLPQDWEQLLASVGPELLHKNAISFTIWMVKHLDAEPQRFAGDWLLVAGAEGRPPSFTEAEAWGLKRAKAKFDPEHKFNPGVLGVV